MFDRLAGLEHGNVGKNNNNNRARTRMSTVQILPVPALGPTATGTCGRFPTTPATYFVWIPSLYTRSVPDHYFVQWKKKKYIYIKSRWKPNLTLLQDPRLLRTWPFFSLSSVGVAMMTSWTGEYRFLSFLPLYVSAVLFVCCCYLSVRLFCFYRGWPRR